MSSVPSVGDQTLGKDAFLRLFTTQARMQNPMNPMESQDFLAQLAQFTSLEQMSNLNQNFEKMFAAQQVLQAAQLIGKTVSYAASEADSGVGRVTGVRLSEDGVPMLLLGNKQVSLESVTSFEQYPQDGETVPAVMPY